MAVARAAMIIREATESRNTTKKTTTFTYTSTSLTLDASVLKRERVHDTACAGVAHQPEVIRFSKRRFKIDLFEMAESWYFRMRD
jgi:hypothetical protein